MTAAIKATKEPTPGIFVDPDRVTVTKGALSLADVIIDPSIQRGVQRREVNAITGEFNPLALGTVTASLRDNGDMVLLDGQQRLTAAVAAGYEGKARADIYEGLTRQEEAALFRQLNFRQKVNLVDIFRAQVVEGDPRTLAINDILHEFNLEVSINNNGFAAIATAQRIMEWQNGAEILRWSLDVIITTWGQPAKGIDGRFLEALAMVRERYGDLVNTDILRKKLVGVASGIHGILGTARTIRAYKNGRLQVCVVEAIIGIYNKDFRKEENKLPDWVR